MSDPELELALRDAQSLNQTLTEELRGLYRRLHIELAPERRSELIIELLSDSREGHQLLGFELADRDLSASVDLSDAVGIAVRGLIESEAAQIRAQSARLITRLGQPDAMLVLTDALQTEDSPIAAEPMLLGIARWPNGDALDSVRRWIDREDAPLFACFSAAWSIEREGLWAPGQNHAHMISRLRRSGPREMREDGMKLLAKLGTAEDLRRLIGFMLSEDPNVVRWAASALVETPRAVEELLLAASKNEVLYQAAAESLIQHRATPEGMRRLSELPQADSQIRRDMLLRMGRVIDREQLGEAVRLARLDEETAISVLSRLVGNEEPITARSAKGVLQLAELQLRAGRPNRVIEAILSLENATIEPEDQARLIAYRTKAMLLLGRFQEAADGSIVANTWIEAIGLASDPQLKRRIATELTSRAGESLDEAQLKLLTPFTRPVETPERDEAQSQTED